MDITQIKQKLAYAFKYLSYVFRNKIAKPIMHFFENKSPVDKIKGGASSIKDNDIYLYQSSKNHELFNPNLIKTISVLFIIILFSFIVLASITNIKEAAIASGDIEPLENIIELQHFDGGIVTKIHVNEGDTVKEGEILLTLDGIGAKEDLQRYITKNATLKLQQERIYSILHHIKPNFSKYTSDPHVIKEQQNIYQDMIEAAKSEKEVIQKQLSQQQYVLQAIKAKKEYYANEIKVGQQIMSMYQTLAVDGHTSKLKLLEEQRRVNALQREFNAATFEIKKIQEAVQEYQTRLQSYDANQENTLNQQHEKIVDEISENNEYIKKLKQKAGRLSLRSPVAGIVKAKNVTAVGESIYPNKTLFEIVPFSTPLIATLHISPNDIGHVKVGDLVRIKVSAYDYIKYGIVEGHLYQISASTFVDDKGLSYYRGRVKLEQNYIMVKSSKKYLMPGMLIKAEIVTGERTILEYLLKPIYRSMDSGLVER